MEDTNKRLLLLNMNLQQKTQSLFFEIMGFLKNKFETFEILTDDNFSRKKDRMFTDIHLFIKLKNGEYFHLKAYSEYNIQNIEMYENNKIYLTGYLKNSKEWKGGKHSLTQKWYNQSAKEISKAMIEENKNLFTEN